MRNKVNDIQLNVDISGQGPPLILLHGFTGNHATWEPFKQSWGKHFTLIAFDIIGHGQSDAPENAERYTMEHAVNDIVTFLDTKHIEHFYTLGYSMGGRLAIALATQCPSRVKALILESTSPGLETLSERNARMQQDEQLAERIIEDGIEAFVDHWENIPMFKTQKALSQDIQQCIRTQRLQNTSIGLANSLKGMGTGAQRSYWSELHLLQMPTLLIVGDNDEKFCSINAKMKAALPNATMVMCKDAGHAVHVEKENEYEQIVIDYLLQTREGR